MEREVEVLKQELEKQKFNTEAEMLLSKKTESYNKLKEFYEKLRSDHIELIRKVLRKFFLFYLIYNLKINRNQTVTNNWFHQIRQSRSWNL